MGISVADGGVDGQLLDETVGQFRVVAAQQGDGVGRAREVLALGVAAQGLLQVLDVEAINGSWSGSLLGSLPGAVSCTAPATSPPTWRNNSKVSVLVAPEALIMSRSATGSSGSRPRR